MIIEKIENILNWAMILIYWIYQNDNIESRRTKI
jgi:hypothetical protein